MKVNDSIGPRTNINARGRERSRHTSNDEGVWRASGGKCARRWSKDEGGKTRRGKDVAKSAAFAKEPRWVGGDAGVAACS